MKVYLILVINLFLFSLLIPIVGAFDVSEFDFTYPEARFDNNTAFVNSSSSWITPSLGILADVNATWFENVLNTLTLKTSQLASWINDGWLRLDGGTMEGSIDMDSNSILNLAGLTLANDINLIDKNWLVPTPTLPNHTTNKDYVDDATSSTAFDFFFNNFTSDISGHFNMTETDLELPESELDSVALGTGTQSIFNWTTLVGQPEFNELRQGVYDVHVHLETDGPGKKPVIITPKLYNISADGTERNLLVTFETTGLLLSVGTEYDLHGVLTEPIMLADGERLNLELEAEVGAGGGDVTVTIEMEGTTDSHLSVQTSSNAFEKIFIRRDGTNTLVGNWQVDSVTNPFNINMSGNVSAGIFFGDGSQLTGIDTGMLNNTEGGYVGLFNTINTTGDITLRKGSLSIGGLIVSDLESLHLKGWQEAGNKLGGNIIWYEQRSTIVGYTFANDDNRFVLSNLEQQDNTDVGKWFVSFDNGDEGSLDNAKRFFGTDLDASIEYDGINLRINPREVGIGIVDIIAGGLNVDGSDGISAGGDAPVVLNVIGGTGSNSPAATGGGGSPIILTSGDGGTPAGGDFGGDSGSIFLTINNPGTGGGGPGSYGNVIIAPTGGKIFMGRNTSFGGGNASSILQLTGDFSVNGTIFAFSPSLENYDRDNNKLINNLPMSSDILGSDGKLNRAYLFDKEKVTDAWNEYPFNKTSDKWGVEVPDLDRPVEYRLNKTDMLQITFNNRIMIDELKTEVDNLETKLCINNPLECVVDLGIRYIVERIINEKPSL